MGFNEFMTKLFGNKSQRDLKEITPYVDKVKAVYPSIKALSNDELRAKTDEIKQRIQDYVAEEKAQVEELRKGIEDKEDVYKRQLINTLFYLTINYLNQISHITYHSLRRT